ncbi:MAG: hypothetical protein KF847_02025 [Pirellulales bacterium]|nr:hypothetical protein [Pirellulales bacterium]
MLACSVRRPWIALLVAFCAANVPAARASDRTEPREPMELVVANSIPDGGGYVWKDSTGVPRTIRHAGQIVLEKQPRGTYCSGFTFAVAMETLERRGLLRDKSFAQVKQFQREWYGAAEDAGEKQCALAVKRLGVGREVRLADARPGDFVQLWRTDKSGHSVVLAELVREEGAIVGLKYRSSQKLTDGVGDRVERFADAPGRQGKLDRKRIYVARLDGAP